MEESIGAKRGEQVVVFRLGQETYGIDIFRVQEIIRLCEITPIPGASPHLRGLINLRGTTLPVVDLRLRFQIPVGADEDARIIVVESEQGNIGLIVDSVREVLTLTHGQIEATPSIFTGPTAALVRGVAQHGDGLITMLDLDQAIAA
jgi:purine-binding chemotaxis protein CheW